MTETRLVSIENEPIWIQFKLGEVHCIEQIVSYIKNGSIARTWTCKGTDRKTCEGSQCEVFSLKVEIIDDNSHDPIPSSVCTYGNNILIEKDSDTDKIFVAAEIAIKGKEGI